MEVGVEELLAAMRSLLPQVAPGGLGREWGPGNFRCQGCVACDDCKFCLDCQLCRSCTHCQQCQQCEQCTQCRRSLSCGRSSYLEDCRGCEDSSYLLVCVDCRDCVHCLGCVGLQGAEFCVLNQQLSRQDYFARVRALRQELDAKVASGWKISQLEAESDAPAPRSGRDRVVQDLPREPGTVSPTQPNTGPFGRMAQAWCEFAPARSAGPMQPAPLPEPSSQPPLSPFRSQPRAPESTAKQPKVVPEKLRPPPLASSPRSWGPPQVGQRRVPAPAPAPSLTPPNKDRSSTPLIRSGLAQGPAPKPSLPSPPRAKPARKEGDSIAKSDPLRGASARPDPASPQRPSNRPNRLLAYVKAGAPKKEPVAEEAAAGSRWVRSKLPTA